MWASDKQKRQDFFLLGLLPLGGTVLATDEILVGIVVRGISAEGVGFEFAEFLDLLPVLSF